MSNLKKNMNIPECSNQFQIKHKYCVERIAVKPFAVKNLTFNLKYGG
jgi:hypothetical protein